MPLSVVFPAYVGSWLRPFEPTLSWRPHVVSDRCYRIVWLHAAAVRRGRYWCGPLLSSSLRPGIHLVV